MIAFTSEVDPEAPVLGCFFVAKKTSAIRLVFDTRMINCGFRDPPATDLPSGDAFARVLMSDGDLVHIASGDVSNAYYNLAVPDDLGREFRIPSLPAHLAGVGAALSCPGDGAALVQPYLRVLPMGWSWALHLCQRTIEYAMEFELGLHRRLRDREPGRSFDGSADDVDASRLKHANVVGAIYVDNYCVLSTEPKLDLRGWQAVSRRLQGLGLVVHEETEAGSVGEFIGMQLHNNRIRVKPKKLWRRGIAGVLRRPTMSGAALEVIVGHLTWHCLGRRPTLAISDGI